MGLIAKDRSFAFIHVMKAGGTSIKKALAGQSTQFSDENGLERFLLTERPSWFGRLPNVAHAPAEAVAEFIGRDRWEGMATFAVVRNPWDWLLSLYSYIIKLETHYQHRYVKLLTFEEFVAFEAQSRGVTQSDCVCEADGRIAVSRVFRLEDLASNGTANLSAFLGRPIALGRENTTKHRHYRDLYTSTARALVERYYFEDIERFGYSF